MLDTARVWLVVENEQEQKMAEQIKQKTIEKEPYKTLEITYKILKPFLRFNYLQIGYYLDDEHGILSGILRVNRNEYKLCDFKAETTINMFDFKPFFKKLTENIKMHSDTPIKILYYKDSPVWFEIQYEQNGNYEKRIGIILPQRSE